MRIGCPSEIKNHEYRVGLTPESARELVANGHEVWVQTGAGAGIGAYDDQYETAGARIVGGPDEIFAECEMIVKVKEPQAAERAKLREGQILYTYLHLAPDPEQTADLVKSGVTAIAYETVTGPNGILPLLKPMSQVAGRMSIQAGATALEKAHGGRGVLLGGVPGVMPGKVAVIGGGVVGFNAAQMAVGLGADVTILDRDPEVLEKVGTHFESRASTRFSNKANLEDSVCQADLVIGAVLIPGAAAPKLITREMLSDMQPGAVLVDVAIDQGGCFETSKATTHADPTYIVDDIVHYCVANMPGAVARTSTYALNNVTLPHALRIARDGWKAALRNNPHLAQGLNVHAGSVTYEAVASELGYDYRSVDDILGETPIA
ncbi:Alanine dehydrogenase [Alteripontixanthobacter maritimus]|uniref:Alanine dehydrogenase n=1 Tax=Alteripontixanthobacter maritimus TaxID=2161824 RepID=A0A369Q3J5_9SPHN|nr:alanine dehydrogenase [Alteripontixanthobacter maritimus]RDC59030.1 Alanine dehydrogenase [Alteripontixanthobacter maritimus]